MGYRFTLESANIVANLTCGKVISCYNEIYRSQEEYDNFLYFLRSFPDRLYSENSYDLIHRVKGIIHNIDKAGYQTSEKGYENSWILKNLRELSVIFDRCRVKSLLLPPFTYDSYYRQDDFMTKESTIRYLFERHPGDSCLILQPQEIISRDKITIFDAFPYFEVALNQIDLWPAVLFWDNNKDFVFVPVSDIHELFYLYEILYYERDSLGQIKKYASQKKKTGHYYFHLSDLHFGAKNVGLTERRLKSLITNELSKLDYGDQIDFIITGDAVDSPSSVNDLSYMNFSDFLESKSGNKPLSVLGNHDVNYRGLAFGRNNQMIAHSVAKYPRIEVDKELNIIFLLFNSNVGGHLAEGEIGQAQMAEMGNILDDFTGIESYKLVAVLHHHVIPIKRPDFYDQRWYERIMPENFLENSLRLTDSDLFLEWLQRRNVKLVLHGHKHIPFITEVDGIHIISCGSSTGQITHKDRRMTYLSYNVLKFTDEEVVCSQFAEELLGAGAKDIRSVVIKY